MYIIEDKGSNNFNKNIYKKQFERYNNTIF